MAYRYYICDVFTDEMFGGNPLAVIPDASGLNDEKMQKIAREFNFSESTFVFPAESEQHHRKVRIFTPSREVPFAGHPNVGTAYALTSCGDLSMDGEEEVILFEEKAGVVSIKVETLSTGNRLFSLTAPETLSTGKHIPIELVAQALSLNEQDISLSHHHPMVASVGLAFVFVELNSLQALKNAKINLEGFEKIAELGVMPDLHVYTLSGDDFDIRARMFAPFDGVSEDPATGSANSALAALLASKNKLQNGHFHWRIAQGVEMGRPSTLNAFASKKEDQVVSCGVAGQAVMVSRGELVL